MLRASAAEEWRAVEVEFAGECEINGATMHANGVGFGGVESLRLACCLDSWGGCEVNGRACPVE